MPRRADRAEVVAAVRALAARHPERALFVGIDGFGGAGKSSLAALVAAGVPRAVIVHVDDFWGPSIAEWDWERFRTELLRPLLAGRPARYRLWDRDRDAGGGWAEVPADALVVVEGVSATRAEAGVPWDLTVWVDAPQPVRLRRAIERDGLPMLPRWLADWMPSEQRYAAREQPRQRVDLLVDGTA